MSAGRCDLSETPHKIVCRGCGQEGELWIADDGSADWSFVAVGFVGLGVSRNNLGRSVLRCLECGSMAATIGSGETD
jgi:hypothetical protein